jgi:hypothetical protein
MKAAARALLVYGVMRGGGCKRVGWTSNARETFNVREMISGGHPAVLHICGSPRVPPPRLYLFIDSGDDGAEMATRVDEHFKRKGRII